MKSKGSSLLITSILLVNVVFLFPSLTFAPVEALDYGMDQDLGSVDASYIGEMNVDTSGMSIDIAGDVNGDGYDDILIGAMYNDENGDNAGQTYLIFGKSTGWTMDIDLSNADASFLGEHEGDISGRRVAGVGDVNADGYDDFVIGAPWNDESFKMAGQTYLIFGKATGWAKDVPLSNSNASFLGESMIDYSGHSIAGAGDMNGDGYDDILICSVNNGEGAGQTYLIFGRKDGWIMDMNLSNSDASFIGENEKDRSGCSISGVGDVNGDGYDDILIGAHWNNEGGNKAGQTYVIFGKPSGWCIDTSLSEADASFIGEHYEDESGWSVAGAGDVNCDGYDDILIGAPNSDEWRNNAGQTYLIFGSINNWDVDTNLSKSNASFLGENEEDNSGYSITGFGDVNGDGYDDFMIGAIYNDEGDSQAGQTYLVLGNDTGWYMNASLSTADASFLGEVNNGMGGDGSGNSISVSGDVNGDGYDDIIIGAHNNEEGGDRTGQTYLIFPDHNSKPTSITSVKAYSDDEYSHEITSAEQSDKIFIELQGIDGLASRKNIAEVWVQGSSNPNKQFRLRLLETEENTGKFRGNFTIANRTHDRYHWINATEGGWVQVSSQQDPVKFVNLTIGQGIEIDPKPTMVYATEDSPFTLHFSVGGIVPDSWQFDTNASWLQWNEEMNNIYGTPDNSHVGTYWAELKAVGTDVEDIVNFTIQVNNTHPSITTDNVVITFEGQEYLVDYSSTDDEQGTIIWNIDTDANWLNLDTLTGVLNGTPTETDIGVISVIVSVDDGNGGRDLSEFYLEVVEKNDPPELSEFIFIPKELFRGETATIYIEASDPENGTEMEIPILEGKSPTSDWIPINCSYNIDGNNYTGEYATNRTMEIGKHSFRVKLTDLQNLSSRWYYFNDTLPVNNNPPYINDSFTEISVYSDRNTIINLVSYVFDYEDSPSEITWEVVEYSPLTLFDAYMKNLTAVEIWPSSPDRSGLGKINFKVIDNEGEEYRRNVTVEILNASERPQIDIILESPENGSIINNVSVNLAWSQIGYDGAITYNLYFGNEPDNLSLRYEELKVTDVELSALVDGTIYYWKVTATTEEIPTVFESDLRHFTVQIGFIPIHEIEISFDTASVSVKRGESALITLTLRNLGNVAEMVNINMLGELKEYVNMDQLVELGVGEEKSININILAMPKLQLKTYDLTVEAEFSGERTTASMSVTVTDETKTDGKKASTMSWIWFVIGTILILAIAGLLIFIVMLKRKKTDEDGEVIHAEIEHTPTRGITKETDIDIVSRNVHQGQEPQRQYPTSYHQYPHKPAEPQVQQPQSSSMTQPQQTEIRTPPPVASVFLPSEPPVAPPPAQPNIPYDPNEQKALPEHRMTP